jgi:hypothetical protein
VNLLDILSIFSAGLLFGLILGRYFGLMEKELDYEIRVLKGVDAWIEEHFKN